MRKLFFTVGLCTLFFQLQAQWDFRTGYIITNSNDSISGFVRYNGAMDQKVCFFRTSAKGETVIYRPGQIKAYAFLGGYRYESVDLPEDKSEKVFLVTLVWGKLSLFEYEDQFYVRRENQLTHLSRKSTSDDYYVTVLNNILSHCGLAANELSYGRTDLTNLIKNYNNCAGGSSHEFRLRQSRSEIGYELLAAYDFSSLEADNSGFTFTNYKGLSGGVALNISFPRLTPQAFLIVELWYSQKDFHVIGIYKKSIKTYYEDHFISWKAIKLPVGARYNFMKRIATPYVELGASKNFALDKSIHLIQDVMYNKEVTTSERSARLSTKKSIGIWGAVGYTGHFISGYRGFVEARFEKSPFGTLPGSEANLDMINTSVVVGLRF